MSQIQHASTSDKKQSGEKKKVNLRYMRDKDREMVRGIFKFYEVPGGSMNFVLKLYKEDEVERYDLVDGQIYSIPRGVAKHLNKNGKYPVYDYKEDENGRPVMRVGTKVARFGFQSLEFMDEDDLGEVESSLVTVETI